jgi:tetratricopeptide (TPR) repeat protein
VGGGDAPEIREDLEEAIAALRAFALVDRETVPDEREPEIKTDSIRLHRLVREVARLRRKGEALDAALRALLEAVAAVYPGGIWDDPKTWLRARRLDVLALALVGGDTEPPKGAEERESFLLDRLASYRQVALAAYAQARSLFERALAMMEEALGPEHPDTAMYLDHLALLLSDQRDFAAARPFYERALPIYEKALGPEHPTTTVCLNNLAELLRVQGDYAAARPLHERVLAICEKSLGSEHRDTGRSLNNLALLLQAQGDLIGAQSLFERALAICEKTLGPENLRTNLVRGNLGVALLKTGAAHRALPLAETALAGHEKILGPGHPWTKNSARVTADALEALGRGGEAVALREKFGI